MEKIYGYKEKDVLGLAEFILSRQGGTLTGAFCEYAQKCGKAQGTVRNLYYALAKKSRSDDEFRQKYLGGRTLNVGEIVEFNEQEEENLARKIIREKIKGRSVRSVIFELANGDEKMALRYQNKYRNLLKNSPELIEKITEQEWDGQPQAVKYPLVREEQLKKLKSEISGLVDKISMSVRKENDKLRAKITLLERENSKLRQELNLKLLANGESRVFVKKDGNNFFC